MCSQPSNSTPLHGNQTLETEDTQQVTCDWHLAKCWVSMIQMVQHNTSKMACPTYLFASPSSFNYYDVHVLPNTPSLTDLWLEGGGALNMIILVFNENGWQSDFQLLCSKWILDH